MLKGFQAHQKYKTNTPSAKGRTNKPVLDEARKAAGIDPAETRARRKGVSNKQLYQYMVSRAAKDDEHHAVMRNILTIVKKMEETWAPTKSSGRSGTFNSFFHH